MGRWSLDPPDYEEPLEGDENWEDEMPDWWWETSYVDTADYNWNEARYVEWLETIEWRP